MTFGPDLLDALRERVVGRQRESEVVVAALAAGRHVVLEGPPGTGKSTLLRGIAHALDIAFEFVEGNAELTPARLVGTYDPARVLAEGYVPDAFLDGPLVAALRAGSLLYVEEINRVPEETLNVLITVMAERELHVPRLGSVVGADGFRLVAAMNPFDAIGTARISAAVYDRVCRVAMAYQSHDEEATITERAATDLPSEWVAKAVALARSTRSHDDLRVGSSVRGAIDMALVAHALARLRGVSIDDDRVTLDAALAALSGRVRVHEGCTRSAEEIITGLWQVVFGGSDEVRPGKAPNRLVANSVPGRG